MNLHALDVVFSPRRRTEEEDDLRERVFGEFTLTGDAPVGMVADLYGIEVLDPADAADLAAEKLKPLVQLVDDVDAYCSPTRRATAGATPTSTASAASRAPAASNLTSPSI